MKKKLETAEKGDGTLEEMRERFAAAREAVDENHRTYKDDVAFCSSRDQWDAAIKLRRGADRPALTFNRLNGVIKQIIGDYRQNKIAIKVLPANGDADEDTAEIIAGLIRNIEQQSNADMAYANALDCAARGGFGYFRILTEYTGDTFDQDIVIRPIHNPLTVYFDPAARLLTREDANWCFVTEMLPRKVFKKRYPRAEIKELDADDNWSDGDDIRIADYYEKEAYAARIAALSNGMVIELQDGEEEALAAVGITVEQEREAERTKIIWRKVSGDAILETREYKTKYIPVIPVMGEEINLEGKVVTRGAVFYARDAQLLYNHSKSAAAESTALQTKSPWLGTVEHFQGFEDVWATANTVTRSFLTYNPDPQAPQGPQRIDPPSQAIGEMSMALGAADDIKATTGLFDASLGNAPNSASGVAIEARQQEGNAATFVFNDNLRKGIEHGGRVIMDMIPLVYDAERIIRVLDLEGNPKTETINRQQHDPLIGVTTLVNSLSVGKYDVIVTTGPNFASRKREALAALTQLSGAYPPLMQLAGDLVVKQMDFPGAEQVAERIKRSIPPQITVDPDSEEGKAMANQPPPPDPAVLQQEAEARRMAEDDQRQYELKKQDLASKEKLAEREFSRKAALERQRFEFDKDMANRKFAFERDLSKQKARTDITKHAITQKMSKEAKREVNG